MWFRDAVVLALISINAHEVMWRGLIRRLCILYLLDLLPWLVQKVLFSHSAVEGERSHTHRSKSTTETERGS